MSVSKSKAEVYSVLRDGEHATIVLRSWRNASGPVGFGGELLINSSFGVFCHRWPFLADPFKEFLLELRAESFLLKTLGLKSRVFCHESTALKLSSLFAVEVSMGNLDQAAADVVLSTFAAKLASGDAHPQSYEGFIAAVQATEQSDEIEAVLPKEARELVFSTAQMLKGTKPNPAGVSFWNQLWPELLTALREEVAATQVEETAHAA